MAQKRPFWITCVKALYVLCLAYFCGSCGFSAVRAALETFGLVHEHNYVMTRTPHVRWQKLREKAALRPWVVAPISMATAPGAFAGSGGRAAAASSTRITTAEVSAGHRSPRSL